MPNPARTQTDRREAIRQILRSQPAATQASIVSTLRQAGFDATQSSVSRDLRELGAVKAPDGYVLPADGGPETDELGLVADLLQQLKPAGPNLLVVRTAIGSAQRVALALDRSGWPEIVGTVGGDDTVFVATADLVSQRRVAARIERAVRGA